MPERRSEVRSLCADMMEVRWSSQTGQQRRATALLEDISSSGACIQLEVPVPPGAELLLKCPRQKLVGTVRYCVYWEIGYFVGVEFEGASKWSPKVFKPQHMLDLQQLAKSARK